MATSEEFFSYDKGGSEKKNLKFPKGKVDLKHYTKSGLFMWDNEETGEDKHSQQVELRLNLWNENAPEKEPVAMHFLRDSSEEMAEELIYVGFEHIKPKCSFVIFDSEKEKDKQKMESLISHHNRKSYLSFQDQDTEEKDLDVKLYHKVKDYLEITTQNETDSTFRLMHHETGSFTMQNKGSNLTIRIHHKKGASITINPKGEIEIISPKKVTVEAPDILLKGHVTVKGDLDVEGKVTASDTAKKGDPEHDGHWYP